ncbi:MAG: hypothetical protein AB9M60_12490 [Leptothrix sp. (in: b-proteobacteria)]
MADVVADVATADIGLRVEGQVGVAHLLFDGRAGAFRGAQRLDWEPTIDGPSAGQAQRDPAGDAMTTP